MVLSRRVALDGVQLDSMHEKIAIQSVQSLAAKGNSGTAASFYGGSGSRRIGGHRDSLDIVVGFSLVIKRGQADEREAALEAVNAWAAQARNGAWFTCSTKPERKIWVCLEEPAAMGDARSDPQKTMTVRFRAYGVPNWQEEADTVLTLDSASSGSGSLEVGGNAPTCAEIQMRATGGSVAWAQASIGGKAIRCESLGMASGETLVIDHDAEGRIRIRIRSAAGSYRSALAKRTAGSADDFWVNPGMAAVTFSAEKACSVVASVRGRFL